MAIGKRPNATPKAINLDTPEAANFINGGMTVKEPEKAPVIEKAEEVKAVQDIPASEEKLVKRGRKSSIDTTDVRYYNLPIPSELFDGIEDYIYKNRKEKKITIRAFIVECIRKELEKENMI